VKNRISNWEEKRIPLSEQLISQITERARNLYQTRQLLCTEAVVVALNHGLDGGLTDAQVVAMAAPFLRGTGGKRLPVRRTERCGDGFRVVFR